MEVLGDSIMLRSTKIKPVTVGMRLLNKQLPTEMNLGMTYLKEWKLFWWGWLDLVKHKILIVDRMRFGWHALTKRKEVRFLRLEYAQLFSMRMLKSTSKPHWWPLIHTRKALPTSVNCEFAGQYGQIALDQMGAVDKDSRLIKNWKFLKILFVYK